MSLTFFLSSQRRDLMSTIKPLQTAQTTRPGSVPASPPAVHAGKRASKVFVPVRPASARAGVAFLAEFLKEMQFWFNPPYAWDESFHSHIQESKLSTVLLHEIAVVSVLRQHTVARLQMDSHVFHSDLFGGVLQIFVCQVHSEWHQGSGLGCLRSQLW